VINADSGSRMARLRQTHSAVFLKENFKRHCFCIPLIRVSKIFARPVSFISARRLFCFQRSGAKSKLLFSSTGNGQNSINFLITFSTVKRDIANSPPCEP
jgi:transposase